jgi:hypothetical protein
MKRKQVFTGVARALDLSGMSSLYLLLYRFCTTYPCGFLLLITSVTPPLSVINPDIIDRYDKGSAINNAPPSAAMTGTDNSIVAARAEIRYGSAVYQKI